MRIGLDFDNTIIDYRALFRALAVERGWAPRSLKASKQAVKDRLLRADGNDLRWQELQAEAYARQILRARPYAGVAAFLRAAAKAGHEVYIVSHKTRVSNFDRSARLHEAARKWVARYLPGFPRRNLFLETSREAKLKRIERLGCDLFIDDLEEVLLDRNFSKDTVPLLFTGEETRHGAGKGRSRRTRDISEPLAFGDWTALSRFVALATTVGGAREAQAVCLASGSRLPRKVEALKRTGNNQIYRVEPAKGSPLALKRYFSPPASLKAHGPTRDRARSEFEGFLLLRSQGVKQIPVPMLLDPTRHFGLYSFVPGTRKAAGAITPALVRQAADFVAKLRELSPSMPAKAAGLAGDARLSLNDYLDGVERRFGAIAKAAEARPSTDPVRQFVENELAPAKSAIADGFEARARARRLSLTRKLSPKERMLSPSDFGFHNALVSQGRITFVDFEYFGWDDPAKLVADFFHSVGQNLSWDRKHEFRDRFCEKIHDGAAVHERWEVIDELIALEWILIVLNVATPEGMARKLFANPALDARRLLKERLAKATEMLRELEGT